MQPIDVYAFYELGDELGKLKQLPAEMTAKEIFFDLFSAKSHLEKLLKYSQVDVGVAQIPGLELSKSIDQVIDSCLVPDGENKKIDFEKKIESWSISSIKRSVEKFEHVLAAEMKNAATYCADKVGIFETTDLVDRADQSIPVSLKPFVNEEALSEYKSAGRSLAFDLPTAAGFHVARAVELVLRDYRNCFFSSGGQRHTMGGMLKSLQARLDDKLDPCPNQKTIRQLNQFREFDRNRIIHPEDTLSTDYALVCFNNGLSAILAMSAEMAIIKGSSTQGVLALTA